MKTVLITLSLLANAGFLLLFLPGIYRYVWQAYGSLLRSWWREYAQTLGRLSLVVFIIFALWVGFVITTP